eukprot:4289063-Prymnesium_polylepis.1
MSGNELVGAGGKGGKGKNTTLATCSVDLVPPAAASSSEDAPPPAAFPCRIARVLPTALECPRRGKRRLCACACV